MAKSKLEKMPCLVCLYNLSIPAHPEIVDAICSNCVNGDSFELPTPDDIAYFKSLYLTKYDEKTLISMQGIKI